MKLSPVAAITLALAVLLFPVATPARSSPLAPAEVRAGYLLLFDGETTFGWKIAGQAKVEKGVLILGGDRETSAEPTTKLSLFSGSYEYDWKGKAAPEWSAGGAFLPLPAGKGFRLQALHRLSIRGAIPRASVPLRFRVPAGTSLSLRNMKVKPLDTRPLFNGKDLTGWQVYKDDPKRARSRFTVTPEGWLNVKDGAGDLQTKEHFGDFLLQLECRSNGKHLNSGIFFRCIPGQYQNGYEAQIRNQFTEKPTQKYIVQDYDPKTHKLIGKREVFSPAIDYGTGAIYRRMPARKAMSKDGEWFTLTVVANGRHFATWVNGVQMVDWTDNRAPADNPRTGYRGAPGAISIQGHDPTTDLSFRNFRILPFGSKTP